ncbi:MAG: extracellular solute-binding protein [Anaerolineaceae bacterium]
MDAFEETHPGVYIDVRIKEISGSAGMLAALESTLDVAPDAAPSLALMLQTDLETAVMRGRLQSPPGFAELMQQEDWYAYAREMAHVQSDYFGIPFAADAMMVAVRSSSGQPEMQDWENLLSSSRPLLFPASDNRSLFTLGLYLSAGGKLFDEENHPSLDAMVFRRVLEFYKAAAEEGALASSVADLSTYAHAWDIFSKRMSNQTICWLSDYLGQAKADEYGSVVPSLGAETVTLVSGWMWALTETSPEKLELDMSLLQTLTEPAFQAAWTQTAGYLPVRPSTLEDWGQPGQQELLSQATITAVNQPASEILNIFGPVLSEAVYNVVVKQAQPAEAARLAAEKIH